MCTNLQLLEHIHLNSRLHTYFSCSYSEDGRILILTEAGVYILTLKGYIENMSPRYSFRKDLINLSSVNPCENLDIDINCFLQDLPQFELYNTILEIDSTNTFLHANPIEPKPVCAMWSPRGLVGKTDCVLGVLTNLSNLEIYVKVIDENEVNEFVRIAHISREICEHYKQSWSELDHLSKENKLQELRRRASIVIPTSFTWSHVFLSNNNKTCCVLFVGHRDGVVTAWKFNERDANDRNSSKLEFLGKYQSKLKTVSALHWYRTKITGGDLSVGDCNGGLVALTISDLTTNEIVFTNEVDFNSEIYLKVDRILVVNYKDTTYILVVKKNCLCIFGMNELGEFSDEQIFKFTSQITGLHYYEENIIYVLSFYGQLKRLTLSLIKNKTSYTEESIQLNIDVDKYRTHGLLLSPSRVFMNVLAYPCKLKDVNRGKGFVNCFVYYNTLKNPLKILLNDPVRSLRDYWDCFETLRVRCVQEKRFPWHGIDQDLNYDKMSLIKLKVLRWIAKMSEKTYSIVPYIQEYNLKAFILLNYMVDIKLAIQRMSKLLNIYFIEKKLSLFQMRSLDLLNFFLKEMVAQDILVKANLGDVFVDEIYNVIKVANELHYPDMPQCNWCGEKIIGSSCVPYHIDSRCAITLMPILLIPGYKCPFCKCIVSKELDKEYFPIFCPYCDVPMEQRYFDKKIQQDLEVVPEELRSISEEAIATTPSDVVVADCYEDCVKDAIGFEEIEENKMEYIVFTDSEEEDESVKKVYSRLRKLLIHNQETEESDEMVLNSSEQGNESSADENEDMASV